jgi:hypothetical protein
MHSYVEQLLDVCFAKGSVLMGLKVTDVSKSFGTFQAIKELSNADN